MAKPIYATSFVGFTPTATTEATDYPDDRVAVISSHPLVRRWRSTVITQTDIVCDMGASTAVVAVAVLGVNVATLQYAHSANNSAYTSLSGVSPSRDLLDGYYKAYMAMPFTNRYLRIRFPAQTPVDGAAYFSCGCILIMTTVNTWPRDIPTPEGISLQRNYLSSGNDIMPAGPFFISQEIQTVLALTEVSALQNLMLLGAQTPFLYFRNWGDTSQVYLYRAATGLQYQRYGVHWTAGITLTELV